MLLAREGAGGGFLPQRVRATHAQHWGWFWRPVRMLGAPSLCPGLWARDGQGGGQGALEHALLRREGPPPSCGPDRV